MTNNKEAIVDRQIKTNLILIYVVSATLPSMLASRTHDMME